MCIQPMSMIFEVPILFKRFDLHVAFFVGKEFKVDIIMTEKSFDPNLNNPTSFQYLELKKSVEGSVIHLIFFSKKPSSMGK